MGIVTEQLIQKLCRQIDREKVVVWYDPESAYEAVALLLATAPEKHLPTGTKFVGYEGSYFALRHAVEPLIAGLEPPRLLLYLPMEPVDAEHALVELETLGCVVRPGQQPVIRNTRLAVVAREALKDVLGEEAAQKIADQAAQGKLTIAELDALAERTEGLRGVLAAIYDGTTEPTEMALAFFTHPERDEDLVQRDAVGEVAALLHSLIGLTDARTDDVVALRRQAARYLLVSDLYSNLSGPLPTALESVVVAAREADRDACAAVARSFRLRRDLSITYATLADAVAKELNLARLTSSLPPTHAETFREVEQEIQRKTEHTLLNTVTPGALGEAVALAQERQGGFWAEFQPDVQTRWALIAVAGRVLMEAERIAIGLKALGQTPSPSSLLSAYSQGDTPWCLLDTHHRHLERRWHNFDFDGDTDALEQLVARARQRYSDVAGALAEAFTRAFQRVRFRSQETGLAIRQAELFTQRVRPHIGIPGEKVAYFLVDALRFEMARELALMLAEETPGIQLEAVLGTMPTITEIGMAALMPGAEAVDTALVPGRVEGKVALEIGGKPLRGRDDRVQHLKTYLRTEHGIEAADVRLEELLPRPQRRRETALRQAAFLLVTSQEIDALCESGNVPLARRTMDEMLHQIRRAFRVLADLGVTHVICAADHGHLFAEELQDDMKIEAPGGDTVDLHRRVWIGRGGASDPAYLRAKASDFGLKGDLEIATPYNLACFKALGSAMSYFHGGLSPQEIVIPALTVPLRRESTVRATWIWTLRPGSSRITTRFFSVTVGGTVSSLFDAVPPHVRVELRMDSGTVASAPVSASYGFEEATGDVALQLRADAASGVVEIQPNTIALMFTQDISSSTASLHLLEADTGVELTRLDGLSVAISL